MEFNKDFEVEKFANMKGMSRVLQVFRQSECKMVKTGSLDQAVSGPKISGQTIKIER